MLLKVWGCRGSIPTPGPKTVRYGGNTPCVSVQHGDSRTAILDAGTGIRQLGNELLSKNLPVDVDLLISHTHWDHIQGLPFFAPMFVPGTQIRVHGARQNGSTLEDVLRQQMNPVVFPVPLDGLASDLRVRHIEDTDTDISGLKVSVMRVRHPGNTLGLRISDGGPEVAFITDNELGDGGEYDVPSTWRQDFVEFVGRAHVLIHDAMYTPDELGVFKGYGHSSYEEAVDLAVEAEVDRLVLFHHRPEHDDDMLDDIVAAARKRAAKSAPGLEVEAAHEGMELNI